MRSARSLLLAALGLSFALSAVPAFALNGNPISSVTFADATTGYLVGQYGNSPRHGFLSVTHDGGAHWHAVPIDNVSPSGIAVSTAGTAYSVSKDDDVLLKTTDAGATWSRIAPVLGGGMLPGSPVFRDVAMTSAGIVAVGKWVGTEDGDVATIYTGASGAAPTTKRYTGPIYPWPVDALGDPIGNRPQTYAKMDSVAMAPGGTTGWAFGSEWKTPSYSDWKGLLIQKTTNGGSNWTTVTPPGALYNLNDAVAINATTAYAVGPIRLMIRTTDGMNWTRPDLPTIGTASLDAYGVDATDANHSVVVGLSSSGHGAIQWTVDGWTSSIQPAYTATGFPALRSVSMITPTKWIVVGDNETIGRTSDAGATWSFTQLSAPNVSVTSPTVYGSAPATTRLVTGVASDVGAGVASVHVTVRREDGKYWNGTSWSISEYWNLASSGDGWDTWTWAWQPDPTLVGAHSFQVAARVTDAFGQLAMNTHAITPTAGLHGTITPGTVQSASTGSSKTFAVLGDAGYHVADVLVDDVSVGASSSVTFSNINENHTLSATFAINAYTITPTAGANGTITPGTAQIVDHGGAATFAIAPNAGYHIVDVLKDGVSVGAVSSVTFANVTANNTLSATFAVNPVNTYTITPTAGPGGAITPRTQQIVGSGQDAVFAIAPNAGYHIVDVLKDGASIGASSSVTFVNVTGNHTLSATFAINVYTITPTAGANGTITPGTAQTVNHGSSKTFAIEAAPGYHIVDVLKDGVSVGAVPSVTFANVTGNHTLSATFAPTSDVTRVAGADRYAVAVNLARQGWDPSGAKTWNGVSHIIIANGEPGKEADPLTAAGLAGYYDAPVLLVQVSRVPGVTKSLIAEIAAKQPPGTRVKIHVIGGTGSVPSARWNEIKAIKGVNPVPDRIAGADRYAVSANIATRILSGPKTVGGVILIAGDNPTAFYDALAASPIAYAKTMPMLSVRKTSVPVSVAAVLKSAKLTGKPRYAASSATYIGSGPLGSATRLTTSSNRYAAARDIASQTRIAGLTPAHTGLTAKLPDALTGGTFLGKQNGVMLFTDSRVVMQSAAQNFITAHKTGITNGWVIGGEGSVPADQFTKFESLLSQ